MELNSHYKMESSPTSLPTRRTRRKYSQPFSSPCSLSRIPRYSLILLTSTLSRLFYRLRFKQLRTRGSGGAFD